ncbi:MAG TPA: hypothetical protein VMJ34_07190 [Bryobacteraceae bacterium]|nr:hypothetical protein [Bryobacteraceae bacterium]
MALAFERMLMPAARQPEPPPPDRPESRLGITVVFTSTEHTTHALRKAAALATRLSAQITLVVPQVVPYPLPLSSPPVLLDFNERRLSAIAAECPVETTVRLYLCRDPLETLRSVLLPRSLIVIGAKKHWWPTREKQLARMLRRAGHEVLLEEAD